LTQLLFLAVRDVVYLLFDVFYYYYNHHQYYYSTTTTNFVFDQPTFCKDTGTL